MYYFNWCFHRIPLIRPFVADILSNFNEYETLDMSSVHQSPLNEILETMKLCNISFASDGPWVWSFTYTQTIIIIHLWDSYKQTNFNFMEKRLSNKSFTITYHKYEIKNKKIISNWFLLLIIHKLARPEFLFLPYFHLMDAYTATSSFISFWYFQLEVFCRYTLKGWILMLLTILILNWRGLSPSIQLFIFIPPIAFNHFQIQLNGKSLNIIDFFLYHN